MISNCTTSENSGSTVFFTEIPKNISGQDLQLFQQMKDLNKKTYTPFYFAHQKEKYFFWSKKVD